MVDNRNGLAVAGAVQVARVALRLSLSVIGAFASYVLIYGGIGWLADAFGYNTQIGRALGFIDGAVSPLAYGVIVVLGIAVALFWLFSKVGLGGNGKGSAA